MPGFSKVALTDNNTKYFFNGAMDVLQPYITSGKLKVRSGQTKLAQVTTAGWDGATAQKRMDDLLSAHYTSAKVDAVLSPYDGPPWAGATVSAFGP